MNRDEGERLDDLPNRYFDPHFNGMTYQLPAMFGREVSNVESAFFPGALLPNQSIFVLSLALGLLAAPLLFGEERVRGFGARIKPFALALVPFALALSIAQLVNGGFTPLIYFKF